MTRPERRYLGEEVLGRCPNLGHFLNLRAVGGIGRVEPRGWMCLTGTRGSQVFVHTKGTVWVNSHGWDTA